uniref:Serpentine receptor class gamma n=1 Tax=Panagrellus redivivus TaxID=6233 RepID=A0A7E4VTE9_PANRE
METLLPTWVLCIQMAYGLPTTLAMFILIYVLVFRSHKSHLKSSFYMITKILIVIDLLFYWFFNIQDRAFLHGPTAIYLINFPVDCFFYKLINFGYYFLNYLRSCVIIGESLNRFVSILYIDKSNVKNEKWLKKAVYPILAISILISLSQSYFYFQVAYLITPLGKDIVSYGIGPNMAIWKTYGGLRSAIAGFIVGIVCFMLNGWSVSLLIYRRKELNTERVGINLFVISMTDFVLHCFHAATEIGFYIALYIENPMNFDLIRNMFIIRMWIIDLDCLHRPWILFIMSEHIRNAIFGCFKGLVTTNSVVTTSSVNRVHADNRNHKLFTQPTSSDQKGGIVTVT